MKTYGTICLRKDGKKWVLDCSPHVRMKLKRLFPGLARQSKQTRLHITNNREACRDLAWVVQRWPLEFAQESERELLERIAREHEQEVDLFEQLLDGSREARAFDLAVPAREYQRVAADAWLTSRGLLLADDLGIGKTCSAIAGLTDPRTRPALVVTMTNLTRQWRDELRKFAPSLDVHILKSRTPYDVRVSKPNRGMPLLPGVATVPDVIITSYSKIAGWGDALGGVVKSLILDECQEVRSGESSSGKEVKKNVAIAAIAQQTDYRLGLSATPIYNHGGEFYNVFSVLRPYELGDREEFAEEWCNGKTDAKAQISDPVAFGSFLRERGFMLRRTRKDVGRELPDLVKVPHYIEADQKPLNDVQSAAAELAKVILEKGAKPRGAVMQASEELSNLVRQATGVAKAPYVAEFVRMLAESGEPVVVYAWHREVYAILMERLKDLNPVMYTGSESVSQKEKARDAFVSGKTNILLMSLRSGAGLDGLQHRGQTVVFAELDWSPGVMEQCSGRVHRDGQQNSVVAYYLLSDSGSDPIVADVLGVKKAQIEGVRDPDGALVEKLETGSDRIKRLAEQYLKGRAA